MNNTEMKTKLNEMKMALHSINYNDFADKHPRTGNPDQITARFSALMNELSDLVRRSLKKFPNSQIDSSFNRGKELMNVKRRVVSGNDFENGKAFFLEGKLSVSLNRILEIREIM